MKHAKKTIKEWVSNKDELHKAITRMIIQSAEDYEDFKEYLNDVLRSDVGDSLQNGIEPCLCYYEDTTKFYLKHANDLNNLIKEATCLYETTDLAALICGQSITFDKDDPLILEDMNRCYVTWFAYKYIAYKLYELLGE